MIELGYVINSEIKNSIVKIQKGIIISLGDLVLIKDKEKNIEFIGKIVDIKEGVSISNKYLMEIADLLQNTEGRFFDEEIRFYKIATIKILKAMKNKNIIDIRTPPSIFSKVYYLTKDYKDILYKDKNLIEIGKIKTGNLDIPARIPYKGIISHHLLISAATGKGKSNIAKVIISELMYKEGVASLIFDPHKEYFGDKHIVGLKDHPLAKQKLIYFSVYAEKEDYFLGEDLVIHLEDLEPEDFLGIIDLTDTQYQLLSLVYKQWKKKELIEGKDIFNNKDWLSFLLLEKISTIKNKLREIKLDLNINSATIASIKRKLINALEIDVDSGEGIVFIAKRRENKTSIFDKIINYIKNEKHVIIDTSSVGFLSEKVIASSIVNRIFRFYVKSRQKDVDTWKYLPELLILIEEAPRFIGKDVLSKNTNIFERIAREGRKFKVGLCAITQMPSLIPREILSQLNTKIILGTPQPEDRKALIESSAQDISDEEKEIQTLEKGEALITSPFLLFPLPVKAYKFEDYIHFKQKKEEDILDEIF